MTGGWSRVALVLLVAGAACSGGGVYHVVRPGDTLAHIGLAYGVPYQTIARANGLSDPSHIEVGQRLRIPGAARAIEFAPAAAYAFGGPVRRAHAEERPKHAPRLDWPVAAGTVTSGFGRRNGTYHDGIDIAAPAGAPVRAAADGAVAFSGALPGYGNVIILRHGRGYFTVYAHNERHHAREGTHVRRGQLIASVGRSGRTTGPNLHFEVRRDGIAYDPLHFLPAAGRVGDGPGLDLDGEVLSGARAGGG